MRLLTAAMIATAAIIASLPCFNSDSRQRLNLLESTREESPKGLKYPVRATCPGTFLSTKTIDREHLWTFRGLLERNAAVTATSSKASVKVGVFILKLLVYGLIPEFPQVQQKCFFSCHDKKTPKNPNPLIKGLRRELRGY
jgi:hypothetical protein